MTQGRRSRIHSLLSMLVLVSGVGCMRPGRSPHAGLFPPIVQEYHQCSTCRSLHGGIYGKGPILYLKAEGAEACHHAWQLIPRESFQRMAAEGFPDQWRQAGEFFKRTPE